MSIREIQLGDAITVKHGFAFKSKYFSEVGEKVVLTPGNFYEKGGFKRRINKDRYYLGDFPENYILEKGDLVIAMTEQGAGLLGSSAWIPDNDVYLHNQRLGLVHVINNRLLHKKYLYHLFNSHSVRGQIFGSASGTKVRHTSPDKVYKVKVIIPEISSQEKIAEIIDSYDDLIENNRRRIELLEESARLLYKEWFVQLRFPGHEHIQIINGVPEGWSLQPISELTEYLNRGMTPKYDGEGEFLIINQKCIRNRLLTLDLARRQSKEFNKNKFVMIGDVLINSTGTGTLGRVAQVWSDLEKATVDTHVTIVRPHEKIPYLWFGYALMNLEPVLEGMGEGATNQKELKRVRVGELKLLVPPELLLGQFHELTLASIEQIQILMQSNKRLSEARKLLLPRLMNGTLTV